MAETKAKSPSVEAVQDFEGNVSLGIKVDGVFVPVQTVPAFRIQHHKENAETLKQRAGQADEDEGSE